MRFPRGIRDLAIGIVGLLSVGAARAHGAPQTQPNCKKFGLVAEWKGTLSLAGTGSGTLSDGGTYSINESITASPDINAQGAGTWTGNFNETIHIDDTESHPDGTFTHITDDETIPQGPISAISGGLLPGAGLNANLSACTFEFDWDPSLHATITTNTGTEFGTPTQYGFVGLQQSGSVTFSVGSIQSPLPTDGPVLSGNAAVNYFSALLGDPANWTLTWSLSSVIDWELQVLIPQYPNWRPTAGRRETDTGLDSSGKSNLLTIQALLVDKKTQKPVDFPPDSMTFLLVKASKEPGVALNWPNPASTVPLPDLSFDPNQPANANFQINSDGTQAQISPTTPPNIAPVTIVLSPHDWGGWATLNVTASFGGQQIQGYLKQPSPATSDRTEYDILLPQRQPNSFIADSWKSAHGVALDTPDNDDSEDFPNVIGPPGDGFTLYEEYRGFYMGCALSAAPVVPEKTPGAVCKHVEGDPLNKDIFVVNELSDGLGIEKFRAATGLTVHHRGLSMLEVDRNRLINFNFSQGPHLQNDNTLGQHALHIHWLFGSGNSSALPRPGLPRQVQEILIASVDSLMQPAPGPNPGDNLYTSTVAHELSHGVNVLHHGVGDTGKVYWYADPQGQVWETGTLDPAKGANGGVPIRVFFESENPNTALPLGPYGLGLLTDCPTHDFTCPPKPNGSEQWTGNRVCSGTVTQGREHSGDVNCLMRYSNATAYIPLGYPDVRYYLFGIREAIGYSLTNVSAGTGVNDPNKNVTGLGPLSRYGDADTQDHLGNCSEQIVVSDLSSPPTRTFGPACPATAPAKAPH